VRPRRRLGCRARRAGGLAWGGQGVDALQLGGVDQVGAGLGPVGGKRAALDRPRQLLLPTGLCPNVSDGMRPLRVSGISGRWRGAPFKAPTRCTAVACFA
jgi:hypothetical protein